MDLWLRRFNGCVKLGQAVEERYAACERNATTFEQWMVVDVDNNAAVGVVRLQEVWTHDIFDAMFVCMCIII